MLTLLLFIVVLGQPHYVQGLNSKSALMEKVTSDPERNIHCVIYITDKSSRDIGLTVPAIFYKYRKNGYRNFDLYFLIYSFLSLGI